MQQSEKQINLNYCWLDKAFDDPNINGVCLEGGSRSGKTWSVIIWLLNYCSHNKGKTINIIRETYNSFKTTLYEDFGRIVPAIPGARNPFTTVENISTYRILGNTIKFLGADSPDKFDGAGCDIAYFNEMLDIEKAVFDQQTQRTRQFWIADWNPKTTDNWCFDLEKQPDVKFFRSTLMQNPFVTINEKKKILSYEPTPENIAKGTADKYRWAVYGLGERAARAGLVHPDVTWINQFPTDCEKIGYGMDFGFTNSPTAIVRAGNKGNDLYAEVLFYRPTPVIKDIIEACRVLIPSGSYVTCDSAEPGILSDLRRANINAIPCRKFAGSVKYGIDLINRHRLFFVRNVDFRKEQENRVWRYVGGVPLNEPEPGNDHALDALSYLLQTGFRS
jgi:phage terminase large subunit